MRAAGLCFLATLSVAGCVSDAPPPVAQSFSALHYDYLPKLRLNVATIEVIDRSLPVAPQDVASSSPAVPAQALAQMARDRLFARMAKAAPKAHAEAVKKREALEKKRREDIEKSNRLHRAADRRSAKKSTKTSPKKRATKR